ncbi:hypothetical protein CROQUDRAFT_671582 [Cronartium quercuum f. sp. fusiforme G11]|uniref:Uncharacterized protein n=1 Tax=Cronartium quercuum f. sp. fusiforme G11 TaxID=708437 RepID=A0A9P6NLE5_9BASI|nr:hypothetical protein CROQUDRAFT_671582 [Cronartium quercuum f. sp. fusiforme G11]
MEHTPSTRSVPTKISTTSFITMSKKRASPVEEPLVSKRARVIGIAAQVNGSEPTSTHKRFKAGTDGGQVVFDPLAFPSFPIEKTTSDSSESDSSSSTSTSTFADALCSGEDIHVVQEPAPSPLPASDTEPEDRSEPYTWWDQLQDELKTLFVVPWEVPQPLPPPPQAGISAFFQCLASFDGRTSPSPSSPPPRPKPRIPAPRPRPPGPMTDPTRPMPSITVTLVDNRQEVVFQAPKVESVPETPKRRITGWYAIGGGPLLPVYSDSDTFTTHGEKSSER